MKFNLLVCFVAATILSSCVKEEPSETAVAGGCDALKSVHQITATTTVQIGDPITVSVPEIQGYRIFSWIGPNHFTSQYAHNEIATSAQLKYEGWYYVHVSNPECEGQTDSIYVDVLLNQGTPACTVAANTTTYNNMGDNTYYYIHKGIDASYSVLSLEANGSAGDITILFHPHWNDVEPEDGIYNTINTPSFDQVSGEYNQVHISTVTQSIYWQGRPDKQVFVSHVNGKLQVRFCDLEMGGYNGTSYTTIASGNLMEP